MHATGTGALLGLLGLAVLIQYLDQPPRAQAAGGRQVSAADNNGRGRLAESPPDIPARGWRDVLFRVYGNVTEHRIVAMAAGMTFYTLLAIFPALAALVAIYGLFSDPARITGHLEQLDGLLPGGAIDIARDQLTRVSAKGGQALGLTFLVSLAISLWSANAAMKSLFDTLNVVYRARETRGFFKLNAMSLLFTAGAILFVLFAIGALVVLPVLLNYVGMSDAADLVLRVGRWPAIFVCVSFGLALIYRYGPDRDEPKWRWISWGSALAAALWLAGSALFSWYAANFGNFNATYGSLGAAVGFMTWIWISAIVILIGGELDAELELQTPRDTTTGREMPLGARGATMAGTVGRAG
ncbi:YihY/virulence factor BrkB family protein [Bradyrhizobium ontarionense]|uniref:YihY/virulence factor BrkB family protein n=1 Tax=Bradyrhizobium ontarionense TaxID=2898149 RepID=A0ABY3RP15_9BRAD|nr:YihY/virulence factor BrkB family protein [Bradyrhizobium sp. A19]UFZ08328.1 YihY/virulence factor BrkB family protein [Bradyrhizobium sp. A19]